MKNWKEWTLFLDRDGVINKKLEDDYVKKINEFEFLPNVISSLKHLSAYFGKICVVTNQQGIGKNLYTEKDLEKVHKYMLEKIENAGARIDAVYYCPYLKESNPICRKPKPGMAYQAKADFPEIEFSKSVMVGDQFSDMEFGKNLGMTTVWIKPENLDFDKSMENQIDYYFDSLAAFSNFISKR
jgi:histidinol-phosphate phosphatase family protein